MKQIPKFDLMLRLSMVERRKAHWEVDICSKCRKPIEDEFFIGGIRNEGKNMIFHEKCVERCGREAV